MGRLSTVALCLSLAACDALTDWFAPPAPSNSTQVTYRDVARVVALKTCPVTDALAPGVASAFLPAVIGGAVIPLLIEVGSNALKDAIQKAQDDLTATYVAYGTASLDEAPSCIVVVNGRFGPKTGQAIPTKGKLSQATLETIGAISQPSLYVEIRVATDATGSQRTFRPVFVQFNDTAARNPGNGIKSIGLMLAFSATPFDAKAGMASGDITKASNVFVPFSLGKMARGTWLVGGLSSRPTPDDVFFDQIRVVPVKTSDGKALSGTLDSYGFVTESSDPTFFDKLFLQAASDKTVSDNIQKIITSLIPGPPAAAAGK